MALPAKSPKVLLQVLVVATVFALLALRQHLFVDSYAVNVMFWDQWDFYRPLFQGASLWEMFSWQHGPHRQGVGFLLTAILAELSGWNSRWDAFGVSWVLIGAALFAVLLAKRCGISGWYLVVFPLLFFNPRQYEVFIGPSNISHGSAPILLLVLLCLTWFIRNKAVCYGLVVFLTFCLIFTGFGVFAGVVVPMVLSIELIRRYKKNESGKNSLLLALIAIAISWLLFAYNYHFNPAVEGFRFPYEKPWEYLLFMASMTNNYFGIRGHGILNMSLGIGLLLLLFVLAIKHICQLWHNGLEGQARSAVFVTLTLFVLLFICQTAVGRVFLGWKEASSSSRYVPLLIPCGLAIYLYLAGLQNRFSRVFFCVLFGCLFFASTHRLHNADKRFIGHYSIRRLAWKSAYLATGDMGKASELTNFNIYPAMEIDERLEFLRYHQLNLFNKQGRP